MANFPNPQSFTANNQQQQYLLQQQQYQQQQQPHQQPLAQHHQFPYNTQFSNYQNNFTQGDLLAGARLQASSCQNQAKILASQQQQPFVYQPPNTFASNAQVAGIGGDQVITNDPYNIPASQLAQQQPIQRPFSQQLLQQPNILQQQQPSSRHYLAHQRSLPLPPPILQQLQARQQQQQLQRHYYQAANKLLFDDQRYYAGGSNPLLDQQQHLVGHKQANYYASQLNESPYYQQQLAPNYYSPYTSGQRSRRSGFNLESTRGLNHSLQSQWLYGGGGGGGRRSMAGDLLMSGQTSALGDAAFDADQKIVNDFCQLYDESRQLFNGLR